LELHTVHHPPKVTDTASNNGFVAAAVGIIFDTKNYDKSVTTGQVAIIDKFFDSLSYDKTDNPKADVAYGELLNAVDTNNRWVYKGSVTTPPCARTVYWNVVKTVYPIKKKHLDAYRDT